MILLIDAGNTRIKFGWLQAPGPLADAAERREPEPLALAHADLEAQLPQWLARLPAPPRKAIGVYVAGDGAGIAGADAAEIRGQLAAIALLRDRGLPFDEGAERALLAKLDHIYRERLIVEKAFPFPRDWFDTIAGDVTLCRCEEIALRDAQAAIRQGDVREINRLKALTRVGMGRCQGRMCTAAAAELLASVQDKTPAEAGRIRAQAPVKPIPLGFGARAGEGASS